MDSTLSFEDSYKLFNSESEKLYKILEFTSKKEEKTILDITDMYYQVIMIRGLAKTLTQNFGISTNFEHKKLIDKIEEIQKYLVDNFTKSLHPEILTQLTNSIQSSTENLKLLGQDSEQKTKETIEQEALLYKELRELMSTKEFVEQYEIGFCLLYTSPSPRDRG